MAKKEPWLKYENQEEGVSDADVLVYQRYITAIQVSYRYSGQPDFKEAAKAAGISQAMFRKFYFQGAPKYKDFPNGGAPIKEVMSGVNIAARAKMDAAASDEVEDIDGSMILSTLNRANKKALQDAIKSRVEEGRAIRVARANASTMMQYTHFLLKAAGPIAQGISEAAQVQNLDISTQLKVLKGVSDFAKTSMDIQRSVSQMESETLGSLQDVLRTLIAGSDGIDIEEAMSIIQNAHDAMERAHTDGALPSSSSEEILEDIENAEGAPMVPAPTNIIDAETE